MKTLEKLALRQQERTTLLNRAIALARDDSRICAAWLFGSGYRDDADAFSDIDLWMVVDDAHVDDMVANRHTYVTQLGQPLLTLDVAGNAPVGGGYLMLQYPGQHGPLQLDWYWQPRAHAAIPDDARVLFDRAGLSRWFGAQSTNFSYTTTRRLPPAPKASPTDGQKLLHELTFFWCMALIAAKDVGRRDAEGAGWMLQHASWILAKAHALTADEKRLPIGAGRLEPATRTLEEAMQQLRNLHNSALALGRQLKALGAALPPALAPSVEQFFELAEAASQLEEAGTLIRTE